MIKKAKVGKKEVVVKDYREPEERFGLPKEMYEEEEEKDELVNKLRDVESIDGAKKFFRYGKRPAAEIKEEIESWFIGNGIEYRTTMNMGVMKWIEEWFDKVVENPLGE